MNDEEKRIHEEADLGLELCKKGKLEEGIEHLRFAAERNYLFAIVNLGHALKLFGKYEEAFKWTLRGAYLGDKTAMSNLSIMYRNGQGTTCNVSEAIIWGKKLISLGKIDDGYNQIVSAFLYAIDESQRNYEQAFEFALEGSKKIISSNPNPKIHDNCETVIQLALCYDFGKGTEINKREALKYYLYCAKCGLGIALYNAACIYGYTDDETIKNIDKSIELFEKATKVNYSDAWYELGYYYHQGEKVEQNLEKAKFYYCKAIRNANGECHYDDALNNLKQLSEQDAKLILSGKYCPIID